MSNDPEVPAKQYTTPRVAAEPNDADLSSTPEAVPSIWDVDASPVTPLQPLFLREGESVAIRLVTTRTAQAEIHFGARGEGKLAPVRCNKVDGNECAVCLSRMRPTQIHLLLVLNLGAAELGVLTLYKDSSAGSLFAQLAPLMKRADLTNLIVEVTKVGRRYQVRLLKTVDTSKPDGNDYGDAILRDVVSRGLPTNEDLLGTLDTVSNSELLMDNPALERKISLFHPGFDITTLRA